MPLCGAKDEHNSCFESSCQWGLIYFFLNFTAPTTTAADLSELNLHCEENELGAIIVKSTLEKKVESEESEESSDQSFDLMCRETLSSPINAK